MVGALLSCTADALKYFSVARHSIERARLLRRRVGSGRAASATNRAGGTLRGHLHRAHALGSYTAISILILPCGLYPLILRSAYVHSSSDLT